MKTDIRNIERRLELVEEGILAARISLKERRNFQDFEDRCFADGLGLPKAVKYMQSLQALINPFQTVIFRLQHPGRSTHIERSLVRLDKACLQARALRIFEFVNC